MARRVGPDGISAMAKKLGMGIRHDLPMPAVAEGLMPDAAWKLAHRDEKWTTGDSFNYGIGQGFTLASPLQLAVYAARIATGTAVTPRLIRAHRRRAGAGRAGGAARDRAASTCETVRDGMYAVSNEGAPALPLAHRRPRQADGRQDRHQPGAHHHRRRARRRRHQERAAALEPPRPRALRRLRPLRPPALRHRPDRRARRRRLGWRRRRSPATS